MKLDEPIQPRREGSFPHSGERLIYVMPEESIQAFADEEISLLELWRILWRGKWIIISITALFAIGSIVYALTATQWFRADVVLAPADENSSRSLTSALGGLANLAGVGVGDNNSVEALAVLRSREFTASFIEDHDLLSAILANRDDDAGELDIRDGVKYFSDNIRTISEDRDTRLVTLSIEWTDPGTAADWANLLVKRLNDRMRQRALVEAETNLKYLQAELGKTSVVTLQQSIGRLMESELQKLMLARGNAEFAYQIMDPAQVPKVRSRPKRTLTVVLATFAGGIFAVLFVLIRHSLKSEQRRSGQTRQMA